jgi:peroxiredoxin
MMSAAIQPPAKDQMTIQPGDRIPSVPLKRVDHGSIEDVDSTQLFAGRDVVLVAVPGAFTPTCSERHLPGFVAEYPAFRALGLEMDASAYGMGTRSKRYAIYAEDGVAKQVLVEAPGEFRVSSADHVLSQLS